MLLQEYIIFINPTSILAASFSPWENLLRHTKNFLHWSSLYFCWGRIIFVKTTCT